MRQTAVDLNIEDAYQSAHEGAILVDRSDLGMLTFTGETRLDLINRMSTQNVINLKNHQGAATVLTTDIGRIIDRLILYAGEKTVYCLTSENNSQNIAQYFMRFVFFMDDFQVDDLSDRTKIYALYGHLSTKIASELFGPLPDLPLHHWLPIDIGTITAHLHRTDSIAGGGFFLSCESADGPVVMEQFKAVGLSPVADAAYDYLRIESGLPRFGQELTRDYIPLETGLWPDVSFNKGCYTGQEIIARMESRGRLAKRLVRLQLPDLVERGTELTSGGKSAGSITSIGAGPAGVLALGYVKTSVLENGDQLFAGDIPVELLNDY
ncbi:MAG: glycine cleavage T C-terminal barrel domain-containing protein [Anaerolineae bacterium]|nr:MAG: glycine cleavage T C-terminal barrel domain-containing protein [Anaerolineae bacterium]